MDLIEIGTTGRPHGVRGELTLHVREAYEEDLLAARALMIGNPPIPYFVKEFRTGGKLTVTLENFTAREQVSLLSGKPLLLPVDQLREVVPEEGTPWDGVVGFTVRAAGYPDLGPIAGIVDLPQHYLAELRHDGKDLLLPLHEDLVVEVRTAERLLLMELPEGLLDL